MAATSPHDVTSSRRCPGCGLTRPPGAPPYDGAFHASPECWAVFCEVLEKEFGNAILFGRVHQLSVDAYAVQHAGGPHPDKSVCVHLCGLHLALERGVPPPHVPPLLQRIASQVKAWPHFEPPTDRGALTAGDVAAAASAEEHAACSRAWAAQVWRSWRAHHAAVADFVARHLPRDS
jgi:hypothetical protein